MTQATTQEQGIEFLLQLSPAKFRVIKLLARLQGLTVQEYIYETIKTGMAGDLMDNIEDPKEQKQAKKDWDETETFFSMDRTIILHGFLEAEEPQIRAITKTAEAWEKSPSDFLAWIVQNMARADLHQLDVLDTSELKKTLEEA